MPTLTADQDEIRETIDDRTDIDDLLEEASDLAREAKKRERKVQQSTASLREQKEEIEADIQEIEEKHRPYIERRKDAIEARKEAIRRWAQHHQEEVLADVDGKTYESIFGSVSFRRVPFTFEWDDRDTVVASLRDMGHEDLVRILEKPPYKSTFKDDPELVRRLDGTVPVEEHDEASVEVDA